MSSTLLLALWLTLGAATAAAPVLRRQDTAARVDSVLAETQRPSDLGRAANQLARLGGDAVEPLFARLQAGASFPQRAAILGAFALLPRGDVLGFVARLAREPGDDARRAAGLDLLARFGGVAELRLAFELGASDEAQAPPSPALRTALEGALAGILSREPSAARLLADFFTQVPPAARTTITIVLGREGGAEAVGRLAGLLGGGGADADTLILLQLEKAARRGEPVSDVLVFERVRGYLGHPDARLVVLAASATASLGDHGAVPDLIVRLEEAKGNERRAAHDALVRLTGLSLGPSAEPWLAWLDESLAWWDERADACRVALASGAASEAAEALGEVARQRLFLQEVVPLLQLAARRSEPDLVRSACTALAALPERTGRSALLTLCALPEPAAAEQARSALDALDRARSSAPRTRSAPIPMPSLTP